MHVKPSLYQFAAPTAPFVLVRLSLYQIAELAAQFMHVELSLYQVVALTARGWTLVKTTPPVTVSVACSVRAGRAEDELGTLRVCQQ